MTDEINKEYVPSHVFIESDRSTALKLSKTAMDRHFEFEDTDIELVLRIRALTNCSIENIMYHFCGDKSYHLCYGLDDTGIYVTYEYPIEKMKEALHNLGITGSYTAEQYMALWSSLGAYLKTIDTADNFGRDFNRDAENIETCYSLFTEEFNARTEDELHQMYNDYLKTNGYVVSELDMSEFDDNDAVSEVLETYFPDITMSDVYDILEVLKVSVSDIQRKMQSSDGAEALTTMFRNLIGAYVDYQGMLLKLDGSIGESMATHNKRTELHWVYDKETVYDVDRLLDLAQSLMECGQFVGGAVTVRSVLMSIAKYMVKYLNYDYRDPYGEEAAKNAKNSKQVRDDSTSGTETIEDRKKEEEFQKGKEMAKSCEHLTPEMEAILLSYEAQMPDKQNHNDSVQSPTEVSESSSGTSAVDVTSLNDKQPINPIHMEEKEMALDLSSAADIAAGESVISVNADNMPEGGKNTKAQEAIIAKLQEQTQSRINYTKGHTVDGVVCEYAPVVARKTKETGTVSKNNDEESALKVARKKLADFKKKTGYVEGAVGDVKDLFPLVHEQDRYKAQAMLNFLTQLQDNPTQDVRAAFDTKALPSIKAFIFEGKILRPTDLISVILNNAYVKLAGTGSIVDGTFAPDAVTFSARTSKKAPTKKQNSDGTAPTAQTAADSYTTVVSVAHKAAFMADPAHVAYFFANSNDPEATKLTAVKACIPGVDGKDVTASIRVLAFNTDGTPKMNVGKKKGDGTAPATQQRYENFSIKVWVPCKLTETTPSKSIGLTDEQIQNFDSYFNAKACRVTESKLGQDKAIDLNNVEDARDKVKNMQSFISVFLAATEGKIEALKGNEIVSEMATAIASAEDAAATETAGKY